MNTGFHAEGSFWTGGVNIGTAWEHEFSGDTCATTNGLSIDAPSLRGGTGVGEVGIAWNPAARGFHVDFGIQGYTGKREGLTTSLNVSRVL